MSSHFQQLQLRPAVLKGLASLGLTVPTPVQEQAIPLLLSGRDAIVQAKTGSGKTLAFGLPLLSLLEPRSKPQALVVLPTRELANQVCTAIASVQPRGSLRIAALYGGVNIARHEQALRRGVDVVVGTPGRLKDLYMRGCLDLSAMHILVLDEADQMLDMGFRRDIEFLVDRLPARKQTLVLSATLPDAILSIARKYLHDPAFVRPEVSEDVPSEISHYFARVDTGSRVEALLELLKSETPERALIFTAMKHETKRLALKLEGSLHCGVGFLNGNMSQSARDGMLARFRASEIRYLVATDVAARGLDIEGLTHVFHFSVPPVVENYIHRSGRTGRAGACGKTFCLVTPETEADFRAIRKRIDFREVPLSKRLATGDARAQSRPSSHHSARPAVPPSRSNAATPMATTGSRPVSASAPAPRPSLPFRSMRRPAKTS